MPELSARDNMSQSPFDSPEIASRFNSSVRRECNRSPSALRADSKSYFHSPPGWNIAPARPQANGRAFSASKLAMSSNGSSERVDQDGRVQDFWARYDQLKSLEGSKNQLVEEILCRYEFLDESHQKLAQEREAVFEFNRTAHLREDKLVEEIHRLRAYLNPDQNFIVVLLDGNGITFRDNLLARGENGGREAAARLQENVLDHVSLILPGLDPSIKVTARLYADLKGLSEAYLRTGAVDSRSTVDEFFRGFVRERSLFDIVDVGPGKGRTIEKVQDQFKMHLRNFQCRHIILGCSHTDSYAPLLQEIQGDQLLSNRVTLLEGVPSEQELQTLNFRRTRFHDLVRDTELDSQATVAISSPYSTLTPLRRNISILTPPSSISRQLSELSIKDVKDFAPKLSASNFTSETPIATTSISSARPSPITTWATAAAKPPATVMPPPPVAHPAASFSPTVLRNKHGQRVDTHIKHDKAEVDRVKKLKMCNVHYLRGPCPYGEDCSHSHSNKPSNAELQTLRLVARMAPCMHGSDCDDSKCIYGHICPAPEGRRGEDCIFGVNCRFPTDLHKVDRTVIKTSRV